jgi:lipoprotein-anchoring transpeptidase ErfK/SrfK
MKRYLGSAVFGFVCIFAVGCVVEPTKPANANSNAASPIASASVSPTPSNEKAANPQPVTFPVLDAFLTDKSFTDLLKSRLQLTDEQIANLKEAAHSETIKLDEANAGTASGEGAIARSAAREKIQELIGEEKTKQLEALVAERWSGDDDGAAARSGSREASSANNVPTDTRIVVNAPAYRMDVFEAGRLVKSYKIGIGYPQFPLPTGLRKARTIIFNPTWTPPDEPWVAKMKNVSAGEKVAAGSKLNPLGPVKIPIGGPSLIHGGKPLAKIGTFASHGCVGLTTSQVHDFAKLLAQLSGSHLTDTDIAAYERNKTETKEVKLVNAVPVELRYETIVVEDGKLHIYRDVYDQNANTEENLRAVLEASGIHFEDLSEDVRAQILDALAQLSGSSSSQAAPSPRDNAGTKTASPTPSASPGKSTAKKPLPRATKNQKEIVIEIAGLSGKGYPAPVDLDTGAGRKTK